MNRSFKSKNYYLKPSIMAFFIVVIIVASGSLVLAEQDKHNDVGEIVIYLNAERVEFSNKTIIPYINEQNRTMIPLSFFAEELGAVVGWLQETRTITIEKNDNILRLQAESNTIYVNGEAKTTDSAPVFDRNLELHFVPLRFISENLEADVYWEVLDGVTYIDIEERTWVQEFYGDGSLDDWFNQWEEETYDKGEQISIETASIIVEGKLAKFSDALASAFTEERSQSAFQTLDEMYFNGYQEFIDPFGSIFMPDSIFEIEIIDYDIIDSYENLISAEVSFSYDNYYRINLQALSLYLDMVVAGLITAENEDDSLYILEYINSNNLLQDMLDAEKVIYKRTMELQKYPETTIVEGEQIDSELTSEWYIYDFRIQASDSLIDAIPSAAKNLELSEVFELFFLEQRMLYIMFAELFSEGDALDYVELQATYEFEKNKALEEIAEIMGYASYGEMITQVEQGSDEFERIVFEFYELAKDN